MDCKSERAIIFHQKHGCHLAAEEAKTSTYYAMPRDYHQRVITAATEMHQLFTTACEHVLANPSLWPNFGFPAAFWERAHASFANEKHTIAGRLDFALRESDGALKCFEYNVDSASCLMECGEIQGAW